MDGEYKPKHLPPLPGFASLYQDYSYTFCCFTQSLQSSLLAILTTYC